MPLTHTAPHSHSTGKCIGYSSSVLHVEGLEIVQVSQHCLHQLANKYLWVTVQKLSMS